jgi:UDP-N-acetylglucosamine:LPS N-acetylglucosamine transferase
MKHKILYVASGGGHLTELLQFKPNIDNVEEFLVTMTDRKCPIKTFVTTSFVYSPFAIAKCFLIGLFIVLKYRPHVVISTGSEIAIPYIIFSKILLRSKIIYIECSAQVTTKSHTGRMMYYFADRFYVQWPQLVKKYGRKAVYKGGFLCSL